MPFTSILHIETLLGTKLADVEMPSNYGTIAQADQAAWDWMSDNECFYPWYIQCSVSVFENGQAVDY